VKLSAYRKRARMGAVLTLALGFLAGGQTVGAQTSASGADDSKWHFALTPYLWGTSMKGMASFLGIPEQPVEATFGDIWSNLDFAFLGRMEARKGRWGLATDTVFMNLGAKIPVGVVLGKLEPEVDMRQFAAEGTVFYRVHRGASAKGAPGFVDLLAGARYNSVSSQLKGKEFERTKRDLTWTDALAGVRFLAPMGAKWSLAGRGDVAGFGSKLTFQLEGDLWYSLSPRWAVGAGYRYLNIDYDKGTGINRKVWKMVNQGPVISFVYGW